MEKIMLGAYADNCLRCAIDKKFEDRLYEFIQGLILEAEQDVENNFDTSFLQEDCDSSEMWYDEYREDMKEYIVEKMRETIV